MVGRLPPGRRARLACARLAARGPALVAQRRRAPDPAAVDQLSRLVRQAAADGVTTDEQLRATVKLQFPLPFATVVPSDIEPSNNSTVLPASAVPLNVGVLSLVMLSVFEAPVSLAGSKSGVDGAGVAVSIVTIKAPDAVEVFPASSVAVALLL